MKSRFFLYPLLAFWLAVCFFCLLKRADYLLFVAGSVGL
jgi:hypothetical protein